MQASAGAGKSLACTAYYSALNKKLSSEILPFGKMVIIAKTFKPPHLLA